MMTPEKLRDACLAWDEAHKDMDVVTRDSMILERVFDETPIADRSGERFFHDPYCMAAASALLRARTDASTSERLAYAGERLLKGSQRRAYSGWYDFGHTAPDYDDIFTAEEIAMLNNPEEYECKFYILELIDKLKKHLEA